MSWNRYTDGEYAEFSGTLKDEDGTAIPLANIVSVTLTLRDATSNTIVNTRDGQDILNANDVTVHATTGAFLWAIQPEDTTMVDSDLGSEDHVATITWTYETDKVGKHEHRLHVVNFLSVCTVQDVELYLGRMNDTDIPFVEMLIEQFSARAEVETHRRFKKSTVASPATEYFSPKDNQFSLRLKRYPIDSIVDITEDLFGDWTSGASYTFDTDDYGLISGEGIIKLRGRTFIPGEQSVRVRFAGGLAHEVGGVPMDLRFAAARQVSFWLQRRQQIGVQSVGVSRMGRETLVSDPDLLPDVEKVLANYRPVF